MQATCMQATMTRRKPPLADEVTAKLWPAPHPQHDDPVAWIEQRLGPRRTPCFPGYWYKDPDAIPERHWRRYGAVKPDRAGRR